MENIQNEEPEVLTEEAKQAEAAALKEVNKDELRNQVIEQYGLDETSQSDLIDKIVTDKENERKKFTTAIKQKINWRNKATAIPPKKEETKPESKPVDETKIAELVNSKVTEALGNSDLESSGLSDELKAQVRVYAKVNNVSVKEALKSDYIKYQISEEEKKTRADNASISNKKNKAQTTRNFSDLKPSDFDMETEEGRKGFAEYQKWLKAQ